jgi:hypothetical protein
MPFAKGNTAGKGRVPKGTSLRELLRNHPLKDKRELVKKAYKEAIGGSVQWAEWIAKHSGEGSAETVLPDGSQFRRIVIEEVRVGDGDGDRAEPADLEDGWGRPTVSIPQRTDTDVGSE